MEHYVNNGRYIVPLDSTDVSLMSLASTHQVKMDDCKPIWSTDILNLRNEKRYYQIDMQEGVETVGEASCGDDNIELKTCICFICNIEVPEQYTRAHVNSYKHEMYLNLAKAAVERINKNMNQKCYTTKTKGSLYFCETCVMVMPVNDKSAHLLSDLHENILKKDQLLQSFINIYVYDTNKVNNDVAMLNTKGGNEGNASLERSELHDDNLNDNVIDKNEGNTSVDPCELQHDNLNDNVIDKNEGNTSLDQPELYDDNLNEADDNFITKRALTHKTKKSLFDYIKIDDLDTEPAVLVKCIDENHYLIQIEGECGLKVEFDNYHGIDKLTKQRYQCKLCSDTFKRKLRHISSEKHIKRTSLIIKDKHCIRELDLNQCHCIVCNELFEAGDQHIYTEVHEEQVRRAKVIPKEDVDRGKIAEDLIHASEEVKDKRSTEFDDNASSSFQLQSDNVSEDNHENKYPLSMKACCDLCNVVMNVDSLHTHALSRKHKARRRHSVSHMVNKSPDQVGFTCEVCKIPVSLEEIQNHIANSSHGYRYITYLAINDILILDTGEMFCELCKMYMEEGNEIDHVNGKRHERLKRLREDQGKTNAAQVSDIETSKGSVTTGLVKQNQISEDKVGSISSDESESLCVKLMPDQNNEAMDNVDLIEKDLSAFENDIKNNTEFVKHEPEKSNKDAAPLLIEDTSQNNIVNSKLTETKKRIKKPIKKHDKFVLQAMYNKKEMYCNVCQSIIPNNERSYKEHMNGSKHNNKLLWLFENNQIRKINDIFYCQICDDDLSPGNQFSHIESKAHKRNLVSIKSNLSKNVETQTDHDQIDFKSFNDDAKSVSKAKGESSVPIKPDCGDQSYCNFCQVVIPNNPVSMNEHQETLSHLEEKDLFFKKNEITLIGDVCRCFLCVDEFNITMLFKHVQTDLHTASLKMWKPSIDGNQHNYINSDSYLVDKKNFVKYVIEKHSPNETSGGTDADCAKKYNVTMCTEEWNYDVSNRKIMNVIRRNGIIIKKYRCYCRYCHEYFLTIDALEHITKYKHMAVFRDLSPKLNITDVTFVKNK